MALVVNGHNRKNVIMSFESFRSEDLILLLALGWFVGWIVVANIYVLSKRFEMKANRRKK